MPAGTFLRKRVGVDVLQRISATLFIALSAHKTCTHLGDPLRDANWKLRFYLRIPRIPENPKAVLVVSVTSPSNRYDNNSWGAQRLEHRIPRLDPNQCQPAVFVSYGPRLAANPLDDMFTCLHAFLHTNIYLYVYSIYIYIYTDIDWLRISSINRKAKFWRQLSENPTASLDVWNLQLGWSHGLCFSMADWCLSHIFDFKPGFNAGENRKWFLPWLESKENF